MKVWVPDEECGCWSHWGCPAVCPAGQHVPAVPEEGICTKLPPAGQGLAGSLLNVIFLKCFPVIITYL